MVRQRKPPSATWRTFLKNHVKDIVAVDFFVVPTVRSQILFVFLVLAHHRRRILHFNVTANPAAEWTAQQIIEAFPWDEAPRFLLRDRDRIYGEYFSRRGEGMGAGSWRAGPGRGVVTDRGPGAASSIWARTCPGAPARDAIRPVRVRPSSRGYRAINTRAVATRVAASVLMVARPK